MTARIIETEADIAEGCDHLARIEPRFADALALTGQPPLRRRGTGFPALLKAICSQQLSVAAAEAVWSRLAALGADCPDAIRRLDEDALRGCGLSRPKIRYARALAEADLDYDALARMSDTEAVATLTRIKGIGVWTAEIYLMFSVGRADVFAPSDLALQESARALFALPERPGEKPLRAMAGAWSPWRAVAARLLWSYYRVETARDGITE